MAGFQVAEDRGRAPDLGRAAGRGIVTDNASRRGRDASKDLNHPHHLVFCKYLLYHHLTVVEIEFRCWQITLLDHIRVNFFLCGLDPQNNL